jgi:hypothetical protein
MKRGLLVAVAVVGAGTCPTYAADLPGAVRYSNVRHIPEADDYLGLNLGVLSGMSPKVSYELCEGWCNGASIFPAEISKAVIRFTVQEELHDQDGKPVPNVYRVEAKLVRTGLGRRLVVTSPDNPEFHEVLKPLGRAR